jgi:hypothetical protein
LSKFTNQIGPKLPTINFKTLNAILNIFKDICKLINQIFCLYLNKSHDANNNVFCILCPICIPKFIICLNVKFNIYEFFI